MSFLHELLANVHMDHVWALALLALAAPHAFARYLIIKKSTLAYPPVQYRRSSGRIFILLIALEVLLISLAVLSFTGIHSESQQESIKEEGIDVALALDISASMQAADFPPNRLEALKKIAADFVRRGGSNRIAVYIFAKDVFTQTPLTTDHPVLLELLEGISYKMIDHSRSGGTSIGDALLLAGEGLLRNRVKKRDQVIILVTDGENNFGIDPLLAARFVRSKNIRFHVIGLGGDKPIQVFIDGKPFITSANTPLFTQLDDTQLKKITETAGGNYYRAKNVDVLADIFTELARLERTPLEVKVLRTRKYFTSSLALAVFVVFFAWLALMGFAVRRPLR